MWARAQQPLLTLIPSEVMVVVEMRLVEMVVGDVGRSTNERRQSLQCRQYDLSACSMKTTMPAWSYQGSWISRPLQGLHHRMLQRTRGRDEKSWG